MSYYGFTEEVAPFLFSLCKCKRELLDEENVPKMVRKMTVKKKIIEIFVSDSFEAREKEWALTEAALFQKSIMQRNPLRIYIDHPYDITVIKALFDIYNDEKGSRPRIDEIVIT